VCDGSPLQRCRDASAGRHLSDPGSHLPRSDDTQEPRQLHRAVYCGPSSLACRSSHAWTRQPASAAHAAHRLEAHDDVLTRRLCLKPPDFPFRWPMLPLQHDDGTPRWHHFRMGPRSGGHFSREHITGQLVAD